MASPKYRLAYFDIRALAEPIRWMFHYTGTPFVDDRIPWDFPTWFGKTKKEYGNTVGQIPVFYEEGKEELCQSAAISRYMARKLHLTADNAWDDAKVDEVISLVFDLFRAWAPLIFERDPVRKAEGRKALDAKFSLYYTKFNSILEKSDGDYIAGKKLTHADFWLASFITVWDDPVEGALPIMPPGLAAPTQADFYLDLTQGFPALRKHKELITSIPQIKAWIAKRPKTMA